MLSQALFTVKLSARIIYYRNSSGILQGRCLQVVRRCFSDSERITQLPASKMSHITACAHSLWAKMESVRRSVIRHGVSAVICQLKKCSFPNSPVLNVWNSVTPTWVMRCQMPKLATSTKMNQWWLMIFNDNVCFMMNDGGSRWLCPSLTHWRQRPPSVSRRLQWLPQRPWSARTSLRDNV